VRNWFNFSFFNLVNLYRSAEVLAEYDGQYIDPFHGSVFDAGPEAVDAGRMARVAAALARRGSTS
jgi:hypothetical protein